MGPHHSMAARAVEAHVEVVATVVARHHHPILGDRGPYHGPGLGPDPDPLRPPHGAVGIARGHRHTLAADQGVRHHPGVEEEDATKTITPDVAVRAVIAMAEGEDDEAYRGTEDAIVEKKVQKGRTGKIVSNAKGSVRTRNPTNKLGALPAVLASGGAPFGPLFCLSHEKLSSGAFEAAMVGFGSPGGLAWISLADHHTKRLPRNWLG